MTGAGNKERRAFHQEGAPSRVLQEMPRVGFEPTRVLAHASLSRARLPVPPPRPEPCHQTARSGLAAASTGQAIDQAHGRD